MQCEVCGNDMVESKEMNGGRFGCPYCGNEQSARAPQPSKTLLDEFAMAAMKIMAVAMDQGYWTPGDDPNAEIAESSYQMAKAMMKERARRDEMGNVKEVK